VAFIQLLDMHSSKDDEIRKLVADYETATEGRRTVRRSIECQDRNDPDHHVIIVFFDSYEDAMKNSQLPETEKLAASTAALLDQPPQFVDLDVIEDRAD
jgi:hypothetical protein